MTATNKSSANAVSLVSPAQSYIDLSINVWKETSFLIEDKEAAQVLQSYNLPKVYMEQAEYVTRKAFDTSLLSLYSGLANTVGDTSLNVVDARIRQAIDKLDSADAPAEDRAFFFHPAVFWQDLHGIAKYYDAATLGINRGPALTGQIPAIYDIPVYKTTNVVTALGGYYNLLAHKTAFAFAKNQGWGPAGAVRLQSTYLQEYLGTLTTADIVYGVVVHRAAAACVIKSNTSGFVS